MSGTTDPGTGGPSMVLSEALWTGGSWKMNRPGGPGPTPGPQGDRHRPLRLGWAGEVQVVPSGIRYRKKVDCIIFIV